MPIDNFIKQLEIELAELQAAGTAKGAEAVVVGVKKPEGNRGPRFLLEGGGDREFIRMNSNSYLGLQLAPEMIQAEEQAAQKYGVGPGAVRFISGTYEPHLALERRLAAFHGRDACMITSAAYVSVMGVITSLTTTDTMLISDELNHNSIINAMRLSRPKGKKVYAHNDLKALEAQIEASVDECRGAIVVTDGVFSMRGDYAPLDRIREIIDRHAGKFARGIVLVVDDSHGVGAYGATGRGTEEVTGGRADILVGTLGKAYGVNGGYAVAHSSIIQYLREKNPFYIYSNPITPAEASTALRALELLDSDEGLRRLGHLAELTGRFDKGLRDLGFETIPSPHPVVPLMVRDTERTSRAVQFLREHGVLATGLNFPVVPKGDQLIRFQVCADHTAHDIDTVLGVLENFRREDGARE